MADYRYILANFAIAAVSFALILITAAVVDRFTSEEVSVLAASAISYLVLTIVQRRYLPGRASLIAGVSGLAFSAGLAGLATAEYIDPSVRSFFLLAFIFVFLSLGYLAFALFMSRPAGHQS